MRFSCRKKIRCDLRGCRILEAIGQVRVHILQSKTKGDELKARECAVSDVLDLVEKEFFSERFFLAFDVGNKSKASVASDGDDVDCILIALGAAFLFPPRADRAEVTGAQEFFP